MPDEPQVIRGIDWKSAFPFTLIFRSFRVAIHPSKLVLALMALVLIYFGGRILDAIWPAGSRAVPNELTLYIASRAQPDASAIFQDARSKLFEQINKDYEAELKLIGHANGSLGDIKYNIITNRDEHVKVIRKDFEERKFENDQERKDAEAQRDATIRMAYTQASGDWERFHAVEGEGLFKTFYIQQATVAHRIIQQAGAGEWLTNGGVIDQLVGFLTIGPGWAIRHHTVYFVLFGVYSLFIWAVFGGAIARIAAVHVARDEKISFRQALDFSTAKFLSFISAPIIPLAIIIFVGLVVFVGAWVINVPFFGPIIAGALFFLALIAGFIMTLVLLGLLGGFNLMYPTIAVEGSDSFDAISRSFSYLFARPWRMGFYTLAAAIYGAVCYVFIRWFIVLLLSITHLFVGMGVFTRAASTEPLWPVMWPNPLTAPQLSYSLNEMTLGAGEYIGAFLVAFWVYLVMSMLGAFAISFYISANTIIYVLMRHEVDATELDDVYLEQTEEDFVESPASAAPATEGTATSTEPTNP